MAGNNSKFALDVRRAESETDIRACFQAMKQLRPHLDETGFLAQVMRQKAHHGYALVYVERENGVAAVAGYRIAEYLAWGKAFYVDDLVTDASARRHGVGGALLDWLIEQARKSGCRQFHLDSGVQRHDAHRLYLGRKLMISSHHFSMHLD